MPGFLYKVISKKEWERSQGKDFLLLPPLDNDFIHLAEEDQVPRIIDKFWANQSVVIIKLDISYLKGRLVKERNPGGTTEYYHLYEGSIPMIAVVGTQERQ